MLFYERLFQDLNSSTCLAGDVHVHVTQDDKLDVWEKNIVGTVFVTVNGFLKSQTNKKS